MPVFKLPLSGDVAQTINPWTVFFNPTGNQFGLINVTLGQSSNPKVEEEVLSDVASYGMQLGKIGDAMAVLLEHFRPVRPLTAVEEGAMTALREMLARIDKVKARHPRK